MRSLAAFDVIGWCHTAPMEEMFEAVPTYWDGLMRSGRIEALFAARSDAVEPAGLVGLSLTRRDGSGLGRVDKPWRGWSPPARAPRRGWSG